MSRSLKKQLQRDSAASATGDEVPLASPVAARSLEERPRRWDWKVAGICALLATLVFGVFGQTLHYDFVNYDDNWYVYENPQVVRDLTAGGIARAFTHKEVGLWTPLVTVSHMLDRRLYGLKPGGHHLTNVVLHLASVILLFMILRQMTGALWRSAFVAALFAIHPLKVESVAWISERKDVLSGLFFMLTLAAYLRYVRRPGSVGRYLWVVILFAVGLMSKPMLVTMPFVLLLLDYWPLKRLFCRPAGPATDLMDGPACRDQRLIQTAKPHNPEPPALRGIMDEMDQMDQREEISSIPVHTVHFVHLLNRRALAEKLPLLALSLAMCLMILLAGGNPAAAGFETIPFWARMAEVPIWLTTYLWQMIWPVGMAVVYTHPEATLPWWPATLALCVAISFGAFLLRKKHPYLWMGWLWNLGMLVPVIGIVQISRHAQADHYNYLPQIGLYFALTWLVADWARRWRLRDLVLGSAAMVTLCSLAVVAWKQTSYWRNSETLWTHALGCTRDNAIAGCKVGNAFLEQGRTKEAIEQYREALRINPASEEVHGNLGNALFQQGKTMEAIGQFREALRINPAYEEAHNNLGAALLQQGRVVEAIAQYSEAVRCNPVSWQAHFNLGNALLQQGRLEQAMIHYCDALQINPALPAVHNNLAEALLRQGRTEEAIVQYREALQIDPGFANGYFNLGIKLFQQGRTQEALAYARKALELQPDNAVFQNQLALMLATAPEISLRDGAKAVQLATEACRSTGGNNAGILRTQAAAYAQTGTFPTSLQIAHRALELAEAQSDTALATALHREIKLYEEGRAYEDAR